MSARLRAALAATTLGLLALPACAQLTLYADADFQGRALTERQAVGDLQRSGFNDRASSVVVLGDPWEACENSEFGGRCRVLRAGRYPSLQAMGLNDRISSLRPLGSVSGVEEDRYAPPAEPAYDNRRRANERLYEAEVTAVRAVVATPGQTCWIESEKVVPEPRDDRRDNRRGGAIVGALVGGVLGHQVGGGSGRNLATVGGAVAGAAVGSAIGRRDGQDAPPPQEATTREVQRCRGNVADARPGYWDVSYRFRGVDHQVQMTTRPGRTITVNHSGEPRAEIGTPR